MSTNKNYFLNGDVLYIVQDYNKTTYKLIKLNVLDKKLIEVNDEICNIIIKYDFVNIPNNELLMNKKQFDKLNNNSGYLRNIENNSFLFSYLFYLNKKLKILEDVKFISKAAKKYNNIKYDDEAVYKKVLNLIKV
jgi:hypothetical protein